MTYEQTLQRIQEIQNLLQTDSGDRGRLAQELMGLKSKMVRFPEYKKNRRTKNVPDDT